MPVPRDVEVIPQPGVTAEPAGLVGLPSVAELRERGGKKWSTYPADVLPLWLADMDFDVAAPISEAVLRFAERGVFEYPPESTYRSVAEAFSRRMRDRFGWDARADDAEVVADLVQGLVTCSVAFTRPGDIVLTLTPVYPPFFSAGQAAGRRLVSVPLGRMEEAFPVDVDALATAAADPRARVLLLCNPHNPTGRVLSRAELSAVAEIAAANDLVVVADEIHADLVLDGSRHLPFASLSTDAASRTVTLQSATKAFNIGGLRCGVLHFGSDELRRRFESHFPHRSLGRVTGVSAAATAAAWSQGDVWLDAVVSTLQHNRETLHRWMATHADSVGGCLPQATYLAWLRFSGLSTADDSAARVLLERGRVALSAGEDFGGQPYRAHARLNFATSDSVLRDALKRVDAVLADPDRTSPEPVVLSTRKDSP